VGGTHYYVQSLLFQNGTLKIPTTKNEHVGHPLLSAPTAELFSFLQKVDPEQAARLHPSDRRKIQGRVELYLNTGRPASQLFKEKEERGIDTRWDTLIFWVWSDRDALNERLDKRVDAMIEMGVEEECRELYRVAERTGIPVTSGMFQAIGSWVPLCSNDRIPRVPPCCDCQKRH
jgi:tRNA dimethylallyltransferase